MRARYMVALALAGAWMCAPQAIAADDLKRSVNKFGLLGKWAPDCSRPASINNSHVTYFLAPNNQVRARHDFGKDAQQRLYIYTAARPAENDRLMVEGYDNADKIRATMILRKVDGKLQTFSNQEVTGKIWIKDGIVTGNGRPANQLAACR